MDLDARRRRCPRASGTPGRNVSGRARMPGSASACRSSREPGAVEPGGPDDLERTRRAASLGEVGPFEEAPAGVDERGRRRWACSATAARTAGPSAVACSSRSSPATPTTRTSSRRHVLRLGAPRDDLAEGERVTHRDRLEARRTSRTPATAPRPRCAAGSPPSGLGRSSTRTRTPARAQARIASTAVHTNV